MEFGSQNWDDFFRNTSKYMTFTTKTQVRRSQKPVVYKKRKNRKRKKLTLFTSSLGHLLTVMVVIVGAGTNLTEHQPVTVGLDLILYPSNISQHKISFIILFSPTNIMIVNPITVKIIKLHFTLVILAFNP